MNHINVYTKEGNIKKPVIFMFAFFSVWQMAVIWVGSATGYISQYSLVQMPATMDFTPLIYTGMILSVLLTVFFPSYCLKFCRISGLISLICIILCYFKFNPVIYNVFIGILTFCTVIMTINYISYMIFTFKLRDIWIEMLCEIFLISFFSLLLLNGVYRIPYLVFNSVGLLSVLLCTVSYFLLKDDNIVYVNAEKIKIPHGLFAFLGFIVFITIFTLMITTMLPSYVENANIYIFSGQILTVPLMLILENKKVNFYNIISVLSIIIIAGMALLFVKVSIPLACSLLGAASAISVTGFLLGGYAFSKYKSKFIPSVVVLLCFACSGVGEIIFGLLNNSLEVYLMVMISVYIVFVVLYQFLVPIIQYRKGYGGISFRQDFVDINSSIENQNLPLNTNAGSVDSEEISDKAETAFAALTKRENEVAHLILEGYTSTQIASALFVSQSTVKTHIKNIYSKLYINNKKELFELAKQNRITKTELLDK